MSYQAFIYCLEINGQNIYLLPSFEDRLQKRLAEPVEWESAVQDLFNTVLPVSVVTVFEPDDYAKRHNTYGKILESCANLGLDTEQDLQHDHLIPNETFYALCTRFIIQSLTFFHQSFSLPRIRFSAIDQIFSFTPLFLFAVKDKTLKMRVHTGIKFVQRFLNLDALSRSIFYAVQNSNFLLNYLRPLSHFFQKIYSWRKTFNLRYPVVSAIADAAFSYILCASTFRLINMAFSLITEPYWLQLAAPASFAFGLNAIFTAVILYYVAKATYNGCATLLRYLQAEPLVVGNAAIDTNLLMLLSSLKPARFAMRHDLAELITEKLLKSRIPEEFGRSHSQTKAFFMAPLFNFINFIYKKIFKRAQEHQTNEPAVQGIDQQKQILNQNNIVVVIPADLFFGNDGVIAELSKKIELNHADQPRVSLKPVLVFARNDIRTYDSAADFSNSINQRPRA